MQDKYKKYLFGKVQISKEDAIELANSKDWKSWTDDEIVSFQLFNNCLSMPFSSFHKAIESVLNRPVFTHEFAFQDHLIHEYFGTKPSSSWEDIINLIPEDKRILINKYL